MGGDYWSGADGAGRSGGLTAPRRIRSLIHSMTSWMNLRECHFQRPDFALVFDMFPRQRPGCGPVFWGRAAYLPRRMTAMAAPPAAATAAASSQGSGWRAFTLMPASAQPPCPAGASCKR